MSLISSTCLHCQRIRFLDLNYDLLTCGILCNFFLFFLPFLISSFLPSIPSFFSSFLPLFLILDWLWLFFHDDWYFFSLTSTCSYQVSSYCWNHPLHTFMLASGKFTFPHRCFSSTFPSLCHTGNPFKVSTFLRFFLGWHTGVLDS